MKVYLIYPDISSFHGLPYHPGLASIASVMISRGHEVRLSYLSEMRQAGSILKEIEEFRPEIVGFTAVETQFKFVNDLASQIRKMHRCLIVCGGPYVTLSPEVVLETVSPLDAVIIGEGEYAMADLAERLQKNDNWMETKNLAYREKDTGNLVKNALNPLIDDLDSLPYPCTGLFKYQDIIDRENVAMFYFNRGCPYSCSFCSNASLGHVYGMPSNRVRYRSVASVIDEIETILSKYRLRDDTVLHFGDDLFVFNKKWLSDFCDIYKKRISRPFWCTGRSNHMSDEICGLLKKAGCAVLMMSVESGNDYIRNDVMRRNISRQALVESFELCHKHGIGTLATCIIGLPFETPDMIEDSIRTVAGLKSVNSYGINIFYPYKGTRLREICEQNNFISDSIGGDFVERRESVLNLPDLPKEKILYYYRNWIKLIMRRKGKKARIKYQIRTWWDSVRKTPPGRLARLFINDTAVGRKFKRYVMKHVWNRAVTV